MRFIVYALAAAVGFWVASRLVHGVHVHDTLSLVLAGVVLGILNALVRPILAVLTFPLTILTLGLSDRLRHSLATTNAIESLISRTRQVKRNVTRWRGGQMVLRWTAAAVLEAVKGFRRLNGHKDMPTLVVALRARDQHLGLVVSVENVA